MSTEPTASGSSVFGEEPDTGRSLAARLKLAKAKGFIEIPKTTEQIRNHTLDAKSYTIDEKGTERHRGREVRERKDYKPNIVLEYRDDAGRKLETPKEAYRHLSHKFHGNGPGKNKIDKQLKTQNSRKLKQIDP